MLFLPASDVYSWAKASSKPSYSTSEISGLQTALDGKEVTSNKVTSWSSTTTDTHYPSEKLVKTGLDGKANSSHTHSISQITNLQSTLDGKANASHSHSDYQQKIKYETKVDSTESTVKYTINSMSVGELKMLDINFTNTKTSSRLTLPSGGTYMLTGSSYFLYNGSTSSSRMLYSGGSQLAPYDGNLMFFGLIYRIS